MGYEVYEWLVKEKKKKGLGIFVESLKREIWLSWEVCQKLFYMMVKRNIVSLLYFIIFFFILFTMNKQNFIYLLCLYESIDKSMLRFFLFFFSSEFLIYCCITNLSRLKLLSRIECYKKICE